MSVLHIRPDIQLVFRNKKKANFLAKLSLFSFLKKGELWVKTIFTFLPGKDSTSALSIKVLTISGFLKNLIWGWNFGFTKKTEFSWKVFKIWSKVTFNARIRLWRKRKFLRSGKSHLLDLQYKRDVYKKGFEEKTLQLPERWSHA